MASSRVEGAQMENGTHDRGTRRENHTGRNGRGSTYDHRTDEGREGLKRKNHDTHEIDTPPKRLRPRSPSPNRSESRRGRDSDRPRQPPPSGPRQHTNARDANDGPRQGRRDRNPRAEKNGRNLNDEMEDVTYTRQPSAKPNPVSQVSAAWIPDIELGEDDDELKEVKEIMGFAGFKSTKNRQVPGNSRLFGVKKEKQTQYRQYMNRHGGFNRPLSPPKD